MSGITMERLRTDWANQGIPDAEYCFSMASHADLDLSLAQFQEKFEPLARMSQYGRLLYENAIAVQAAAAAKARLHEYIDKLPMPTKEELDDYERRLKEAVSRAMDSFDVSTH